MRIGIDLDNTIIDYNILFNQLARKRGMTPNDFKGGKNEVRSFLRRRGGETDWRILQGQVYGPHMNEAASMPGALEFVCTACEIGHHVFIVSHKTLTGHFDTTKTNLHEAARRWLRSNGFTGAPPAPIADIDVHFCLTQNAKVAMIAKIDLDLFIDDLAEILNHQDFPKQTLGLLFGNLCDTNHTCFNRWQDISDYVFG